MDKVASVQVGDGGGHVETRQQGVLQPGPALGVPEEAARDGIVEGATITVLLQGKRVAKESGPARTLVLSRACDQGGALLWHSPSQS